MHSQTTSYSYIILMHPVINRKFNFEKHILKWRFPYFIALHMVKERWEVYLNLVHIHLAISLRLRGRQPFDILISLWVKKKK